MVSTITTLDYAHLLARHLNNDNLQCATIAVLFELGIPTSRIGFDYLVHAIVLRYENPAMLVTKEIYPAICSEYGGNLNNFQVEQAIRSAISAGWKRRDETVWSFYFTPDRDEKMHKPTNSQFISKVAYFLKLLLNCYEKEVRYEE